MREYMNAASAIFVLVPITIATIAGDYCVKTASGSESQNSYLVLLAGACLYGASAIGWFILMRTHSLATIGVLYSATTIIMLAALGHFVFNEPTNSTQLLGLLLAVVSVLIMNH
jgi:drug/metabolite transporter (DMT)-like permease